MVEGKDQGSELTSKKIGQFQRGSRDDLLASIGGLAEASQIVLNLATGLAEESNRRMEKRNELMRAAMNMADRELNLGKKIKLYRMIGAGDFSMLANQKTEEVQ